MLKTILILMVGTWIFQVSHAQKKIVILGSSTAAGGGVSNFDSSWARRLQAEYRKNTNPSDPDTNVINHAVSGYVSYQIMPDNYATPPNRPLPDVNNNVTKALSYNPDIIIISMPSNDIAFGYSPLEFMNNLRYLNQLITGRGVRAFFTTTQPRNDIGLPQRTQLRQLVDSINNHFGNYAINFWDDLVTNDGQYLLRDDRRSDNVHPNNTGHRFLFQRVMARQIFDVNSTAFLIPGKIEAENFNMMWGIQTENTLDAGGGLNVGWQDNNDLMDYQVNVSTSGQYTVRFRVASMFSGAQFQLRKSDGTILATVTVPHTGSFQNWQTVSANVNLTNGIQTLRIITTLASGGWNFNWMEFVQSITNQLPVVSAGAAQTITLPVNSVLLSGSASDPDGSIVSLNWVQLSGPSPAQIINGGSVSATAASLVQGSYVFQLTATDNSGGSSSSNVSITVNPALPSGTVRIQAENYSAMFGIQTENTNDAGGGLNVGWQDNNDWMDYAVNLSTAGTYTASFRVASMFTGAQFQLRKSDGTVLATLTVPNTGNFQTWQTITASVTLPAGQQTLRVVTTQANGGWNFNWWELVATGTPPPPASQKIEAENYSTMFGIQTENTNDAGGGLNVGWQDNNDWMDYAVNLSTAGTYTASFRVASMFTGAQFQLRKSDGTVLATLTVPNTGNFQTWQTITASVTLPAGQQTLRVVTTQANGGWNFNWWELVAGGTQPVTPTNIKIQAENYSAMFGIQTENTNDAGGGLNVGWQDNNDWMEYSVNITNAGTYTVNFRVASMFNGAQFQLRNSSGGVLSTITVPNTGNFQSWQTVTASVVLPAGMQKLRIITTLANGGWNINWWEIVGGSTSAFINRNGITEIRAQPALPQGEVFPNPAQDFISLKITNSLTGTVTADVVDMTGRLRKHYDFSKNDTGTIIKRFSVSDLEKGIYILRIKMDGWLETTKINKR